MPQIRRLGARDRIAVAVLAVALLFIGWQMFSFSDVVDIPGHQMWPWWFLAAGALCALYVADFDSTTLMALSGAATTTAFASRALVLLVAMMQNRLDIADGRALVGVAEWALLAFFAGYFWLFVLKTRAQFRARR